MLSFRRATLVLSAVAVSGCSSLGALAAVQAPGFAIAQGQQAELRLLPPSLERPLGGASIRLWAEVSNPNPFSVVLSRLTGNLLLEGTQAADVSFPLGLPLPVAGDTIIPLDIAISFANLPNLADVLSQAVSREGEVGYQLNGTATLDAGVLGQPSFGPMKLLDGTLTTRR
ncbi:MAG TPA: LEA type 2 family protein [Longimicrobiaceae bacterium]|nr:LEA type 2 family protein [Longimicrobiaceae bacterium]